MYSLGLMLLSMVLINILLTPIEKSFSADESSKQNKRKIFKNRFYEDEDEDEEEAPKATPKATQQVVERPTWNNKEIKSNIATLWGNFYTEVNYTPDFINQLKSKKRISKAVYEDSFNKFINQLNINLDIKNIEDVYKKYKIIVLRLPTKDKLVLSCGNFQTDIPQGHFCPKHKDAHPEADTVDIDLAMNPTIVADLSKSGYYDYLKSNNKLYNDIIAEGGYTLHGPSGLNKLRTILAVGGTYHLHTGTTINVVKDNLVTTNNSKNVDQNPTLVLDTEEYTKLLEMESNLASQFLIKKLREYYAQKGFSFRIDHAEHFLPRKEVTMMATEYIIGRTEVEFSGISLVREQ